MTPAPSLAPLDPSGDEVVRAAAAVFLDGRLVPDFPGPTVVETKNSRYLVDRRGGNVVVTSAVRLLRVDEPGFLDESVSGARRCRGATHTDFRSWHPPAPPSAPPVAPAPAEDEAEGELDEVTPPWPARRPPPPGREASSSGIQMPAPPRLPSGWDRAGPTVTRERRPGAEGGGVEAGTRARPVRQQVISNGGGSV